ncbi:galactose-binding domain-like protein, partial [Gorgonomyces haynaldii]
MTVLVVKDESQFLQIMGEQKLVVIDFTASWCGPCKIMKPVFEQLSSRYPDAVFVSVDVDENKQIASRHGVTAMPTFQIYKQQQKLGEVKGADKQQLEQLILKHIGHTTQKTLNGYVSLDAFVNKTRLECLNQSPTDRIENVFKDDDSVLKSDVDEQLIITIDFNQPIKLHSLKFTSKTNGPRTFKTWINRPNSLTFDTAESENPIETVELTQDNLEPEGPSTPLRFVKYQSVHSLTIFVKDNLQDDEITIIQRLELFGQPLEQTKPLSELKEE